MSLLHHWAARLGLEVARHQEALTKAAEVLSKTQQLLHDDLKPRAQ